ncbi:hypothetical protein Tco_0723853 [Tanacetum coccineum]
MNDGERIQSTKLILDSPHSKETLEDAKEIRLKMKDKMIQLDYEKLNALYETFVPQTEILIEQTYLLTPSTSNEPSNSSKEIRCSNEIKQEITEEVQEMLDILESMEKKVEQQSQKDKKIQNEIDRLLETSLSREIRDCVLLSVEKQKNEMLMLTKEKLSNDSKDIQATMEQRIKILENDFNLAETQYVNLDLKMQHQKEKMACDVS